MEKIKELYEKIAKDSTLQVKFTEIIKGAEEAGEVATGEKLAAFAKEAGFDVTVEDMQAFFKSLSQKKEGEISETDIDLVAGGGIFSPTPFNTEFSNQSCLNSALNFGRVFC